METPEHTENRIDVIAGLERIHNALERAPGEEAQARKKGIGSAVGAGLGSIAGWFGLKVFNQYSESHGNDFLRVEAVSRRGLKGIGAAINTERFLPRMLDGMAHVLSALTSKQFWSDQVAGSIKTTLEKNPKAAAKGAGIVTAIAASAGVMRYFHERNKTRKHRLAEISGAVDSIADTIGKNPHLIDDAALADRLRNHLSNLPGRGNGTSWRENIDSAEPSAQSAPQR